ncbi:hypothetical protein [Coraliomargarita parva]|uniref:hypothetical protein n=1 Tax=Coraliomargarita parva TaxID=3014050 RepID=UPI0022B5DB87|nr:hypothetical protein [Coraliomargarita parva]
MNPNLDLAEPSAVNHGQESMNATVEGDRKPWRPSTEFSDVFYKSLQFGRVRGVVTLFSGNHDSSEAPFLALTQELIQRDILVAVTGRLAEDFEAAGLLGEDAFDYAGEGLAEICDYIEIMPVIALEGTEHDADSAELFTLLSGQSSKELKGLPFVGMATAIDGVLPGAYDRVFTMASDVQQTTDSLDDYIHEKRLALGWSDRYHCSMETYS